MSTIILPQGPPVPIATGRGSDQGDHAEMINYTVFDVPTFHTQEKRNEKVVIYCPMAPFTHIDLATSLPPKRKWTTNLKLLDDDNMSLDAIKQRKLESSTVPTATTSKRSSAKPSRHASLEAIADEDDMHSRNAGQPKNPRFILESVDDGDDDELTHPAPKETQTQIKTPNPSRQASVEAIANEDNMRSHNAGQPKNPRLILESVDDDDDNDELTHPAPKKTQTHKKKTHHRAEKKAESCEEENQKDESDDEELSESHTLTHDKLI